MGMRLLWMEVGPRTLVGIVCGCNIDNVDGAKSHCGKDVTQRSLRSEHRGRGDEACATYVSLHSIDKARHEPQNCVCLCSCARMAELADALASGASGRKVVEVRVLFRAPFFNSHPLRTIRLT